MFRPGLKSPKDFYFSINVIHIWLFLHIQIVSVQKVVLYIPYVAMYMDESTHVAFYMEHWYHQPADGEKA